MSKMKFLPLAFLIVLVLCFYWFFGFDYLRWEVVDQLEKKSFLQAIFLFIFFYIAYVIASIPGLFFFDVVAGIVFGQWVGFFLAWLSAVSGAVIVFLAVRYAFSDLHFRAKDRLIKRVEQGFKRHAANYLLFLRLVPCMPFGLVNISLGFLKVHPILFTWTTALGILPISFLYTHAGVGISQIFHKEGEITVESVFNGYIILSLVGLSLFALLPIFSKKRASRQK